jgi:hypothetical protein
MRWPLQPLLELRTRQEETALAGLGRAEGALRLVVAEAVAARGALAEAAERAVQVEWPSGPRVMAEAELAGGGRHREGLRRELARRQGQLEELERRIGALEAEAGRWRDGVKAAAVRRAAVAELGVAWRRARAAAAERQAEAALDDRPWAGGRGR